LEHGALLPELAAFPVPGGFDGELIAFTEGQPDFIALTDRMLLTRDRSIPIAFVAFDVRSGEGENVMHRPTGSAGNYARNGSAVALRPLEGSGKIRAWKGRRYRAAP
jgi:hypothetical protein